MISALIVAEGVADVVVLTKVLRLALAMKQIRDKAALPEPARRWFDSFKFPASDDISRLAVPAPVFVASTAQPGVVAIRNAEGLTKISALLDGDFDTFGRNRIQPPPALALVLDSDAAPLEKRFQEFAALVEALNYPRPGRLGEISEVGQRRAGIFSFPGQGQAGTLEDLLLPLAERQFPTLKAHAKDFVDGWQGKPKKGTLCEVAETLAQCPAVKACIVGAGADAAQAAARAEAVRRFFGSQHDFLNLGWDRYRVAADCGTGPAAAGVGATVVIEKK